MPSKKQASAGSASTATSDRKPWKKKTPLQVMLDQTEKLKDLIADKEKELQDLRKQLQKFEEARKIFEA
jgi:hypothetical protein